MDVPLKEEVDSQLNGLPLLSSKEALPKDVYHCLNITTMRAFVIC